MGSCPIEDRGEGVGPMVGQGPQTLRYKGEGEMKNRQAVDESRHLTNHINSWKT